jgi:outer membrane usher protein
LPAFNAMKNKNSFTIALKKKTILGASIILLPIAAVGHTATSAADDLLSYSAAFSNTTDYPTAAYAFDKNEPIRDRRLVFAGDYFVEIYLNNVFYTYHQIEFKVRNNLAIEPCIPAALLVNAGAFRDKIVLPKDGQNCAFLDEMLEGAGARFTPSLSRLDLTIPEEFIPKKIRSFVPRSLWDEGQPVMFINYAGNYFNSEDRKLQRHNESTYFDLRGGINVGLWQLRNSSNYRYTPDLGSEFESNDTYLQRSLPNLRSQIVVGQTSTLGPLFTPIAFQGLILRSDERMLSAHRQGYAPEIRGTANSNARVTVKQNDAIIYETSVAPGAFVINDLLPPQSSGDLYVEVTESDNQSYAFVVPFSSVGRSLRPGLSKYSVTLGTTRSPYINAEDEDFAELIYERGINNALTLNSGLQAASHHYYSAAGGGVLSTPIGAFTLGTAFSRAKIPTGNLSGWQMDTKFSKTFLPTSTTFTVAGYRYSTIGYRTLNDSLTYGRVPYYKKNIGAIRSSTYHQRQRFEASLNQKIFNQGAIVATALWQNYYNRNVINKQYQLGYQNVFNKLSYSLTAARQTRILTNSKQVYNDILTLSLKLPLGEKTTLSSTVSHYSSGSANLQTGINGSVGEKTPYAYSLNFSRNTANMINTTSANVSQNSAFGQWGAGYSQSDITRSYSANAKGSLVLHQGGVLYGPYLSETFGIIDAKGLEGARLTMAGVRLNKNGYAVVPSLSPYRYNLITLDCDSHRGDGQSVLQQKRVVPYAGAVPVIRFESEQTPPPVKSLRPKKATSV